MAGALIGALRVSLSAETSAFEAGMKRSQRQAQQTASSIQGSFNKLGGVMKAGLAGFLGALSVGTFLAAGKAALDYAGSLGEVAQQLGVTTKDLQVFRYAAGQVGVSQAELETGLSKLTVTLGRVAAGAKQPTAALNAIGISVDQLRGKDTGEAFRIIADGLKNVTDRSQRAAVEMALFGRSGAQLDNLLAGGSEAINELSLAAEKLGIVLSDDQIQKADDTADKLEALKTVLSAQIAGIIADNSDAILGLANALADLVGSISSALTAWANFRAQMNAGLLELQGMEAAAARARGSAFVSGQNPTVPGRSVTISLGGVRRAPVATGGGSIGRFLAGGGGGRKRGGGKDRSAEEAERKRLQALREENQFDQEIRRAKIDVLRATQDLSTDAVERYQISIDTKDAERAAYVSQLQYEIAAKERTQTQADALLLEYDRKDSLERQKLMADENARAAEDSAHLDSVTLDIQRDALEAQMQLADTAEERRDLELRLLDLAYEQERLRLETIMADKQSSDAAKEEARRRLNGLNATYEADRAGVIKSTRGPLEDYLAELPSTAAKARQALEELQVRGLQSVEDGLVDIMTGARKMGDVFKSVIAGIAQDFIRLQIRKLMFGALSGSIGNLGGLFGSSNPGVITENEVLFGSGVASFARGGSFNVLGKRGSDRNMLQLNGLPIARVSYGEKVSVGKSGMGGLRIQVVKGDLFDVIVDRRAANVAAPMAGQAAVMGASGGMAGVQRRASRILP